MLKFLISICLLSLISCSAIQFKNFFSGKETADDRNEKLLKDFDTNDKLLNKFKVNEKPEKLEPEKEVLTKKKLEPEKKAHIKTARKKVPQIKTAKKPPRVKTNSKKVETKAVAKLESKFEKQDSKSAKFWSKFKPAIFPGEKTVIDITYLGVSTGKISLTTEAETSIGSEDVYHVRARIKTAAFYSYLYEIDDLCDSFVTKKSFIPLKFSLIQRESSQDVDDLQLFDHEKLKTYTFYKRKTDKKTQKEKKVKDIPHYYQDPLSVVYFIRGLPMELDAEYLIPIVNKGKVETLKAKVVKKEEISTGIGKREAFRVEVFTKHKGETIKGGNMTLWYSTDERRIFLKFKAKISIGSVHGEVSEYDS